ncbi:MAG TPA: hypothetical protein VJ083_06270 [Sedimentibacter sp.]|nr:hypothetical protein [Sedimentibacter sp.]
MNIKVKRIFRGLLDKYPRIDATQYCFRHSKKIEYRLKVLEKDSMIMQCTTLGKLNPDKNIYFIEFGDSCDGFFAEYRKVLDYLYYADRFSFIPVIKFTEDFIYSEKHPINGSDNPFEYYFEQPSGITVEEANHSYNVFKCTEAQVGLVEHDKERRDGYALNNEYFSRLATLSRKYIRLNKVVKQQIEEDINTILMKKKVIGVHVRGTDFNRGFKGHPTIVTPNRHLSEVKGLLETGLYESVFLATDDVNVIKQFEKELGDKVCYYKDVLRSEDDVSVAFKQSTRENHHYKLGLEVLRDMMTLASCDALVAGISQVSICAMITKRSWKQEYLGCQILDNGINQSGKIYS